jgi:hypothetical protein
MCGVGGGAALDWTVPHPPALCTVILAPSIVLARAWRRRMEEYIAKHRDSRGPAGRALKPLWEACWSSMARNGSIVHHKWYRYRAEGCGSRSQYAVASTRPSPIIPYPERQTFSLTKARSLFRTTGLLAGRCIGQRASRAGHRLSCPSIHFLARCHVHVLRQHGRNESSRTLAVVSRVQRYTGRDLFIQYANQTLRILIKKLLYRRLVERHIQLRLLPYRTRSQGQLSFHFTYDFITEAVCTVDDALSVRSQSPTEALRRGRQAPKVSYWRLFRAQPDINR